MSVAPSQTNKDDTDDTLYAPENLISDTSWEKEQQLKHERARGHLGDEGRDWQQSKKVERKKKLSRVFLHKRQLERGGE